MNEFVPSVDYRAVASMKGLPPILGSARPPVWREARAPLEGATLARDPIFRGKDVPDGRGSPVLLIPGFLAGDGSLAVMSDWLRRCGYRPSRAGMVVNVDCSGAASRTRVAAPRSWARVAAGRWPRSSLPAGPTSCPGS